MGMAWGVRRGHTTHEIFPSQVSAFFAACLMLHHQPQFPTWPGFVDCSSCSVPSSERWSCAAFASFAVWIASRKSLWTE